LPHHVSNCPDAVEHLRVGRKARIRKPEIGSNCAVSSHIERIRARPVCKLCGYEIEDTWAAQQFVSLQHFFQSWILGDQSCAYDAITGCLDRPIMSCDLRYQT